MTHQVIRATLLGISKQEWWQKQGIHDCKYQISPSVSCDSYNCLYKTEHHQCILFEILHGRVAFINKFISQEAPGHGKENFKTGIS